MTDQEVVIVGKDGREYVFPAGFDPKKAAGIVRQQSPTVPSQLEASAPESPLVHGAKSAWDTITGGVVGTAKLTGIPGFLRDGPKGALQDQFTVFKGLIDAQTDQYKKAKIAEAEGRTSEMVGHSVAAAVPVLGPLAASIAERAGTGDVAGAVGEAVGDVALAAAPKLTMKGVRSEFAGRSAARAADVAKAVPEVVRRIAAKSARPMGAAAGAGLAHAIGLPPTAGAVIGSEVGDMIRQAARRRSAAPVAESIVEPSVTTPASRPSAGALPPAAIQMQPSPDGSYVRSVPAEYPEVKFSEPEPPPAPIAKPKTQTAAEQLRDAFATREVDRISKELGTPVEIVRRVPQRSKTGKFTGLLEPVYAVPAEFLEQAQIMGLRAELKK